MRKYRNVIGLLTFGLCLGTPTVYVLRGNGVPSKEELTTRQVQQSPIDVYVQEATAGRIILGGTVNSDLGVAGHLVIAERK